MSEGKDILDGYNVGYILNQRRPDVYSHLKNQFKDVDLPFFNAFIEGGKEVEQERRIKISKSSYPISKDLGPEIDF